MSEPTILNGRRVVRVRRTRLPLGEGIFGALVLWIVTDVHGRTALGPKHLGPEAARRWAQEQGWKVLG